MSSNLGWSDGVLGDFITLQRGYDLPSYKREKGDIPVITSSGVSDTHSISKASGPGVVMGRYGTLGQIYYVKSDYWPHNTSLFVKDFKGNYPQFIYYHLQTLHYQAHNDKSSVPGLNRNDLHRIEVSMPPLPEQHAIAHILGSLDDKIEANHHMNETLEATARAVFKSWFVDFDPVYAKMDGEMPYGMDAETAALFPDELVDSELGLIPMGWEVGTLGDDFEMTMGQSPPGDTYNEIGDGLPFYQGRRDFGFRYPSLRVFCNAPKRLAQAGDTLVSVRAPVGDVNMAIEECCIGRGVAAIRHKSGSRSYSYYAMLSLGERFKNYDAEGTVFGSISGKDFRGLDFLIPPKEVVSLFESIAFGLDEQIEVITEQSRTLAETRDALLPKLVSGELHVGDV